MRTISWIFRSLICLRHCFKITKCHINPLQTLWASFEPQSWDASRNVTKKLNATIVKSQRLLLSVVQITLRICWKEWRSINYYGLSSRSYPKIHILSTARRMASHCRTWFAKPNAQGHKFMTSKLALFRNHNIESWYTICASNWPASSGRWIGLSKKAMGYKLCNCQILIPKV